MSDEDDRDTLPPSPDPLMAICERLESKIDKLVSMASLFFETLQETRAEMRGIDERVKALEAMPHGGSVRSY